ncbi:ABC multidrug transporter [Phlyctema vagabunda]|uniref:ABC multidrug transporter n=1 Tax=Phlyctema vagabunda TaxID=108571 RepID=A0ABR4PAV0_9HELO
MAHGEGKPVPATLVLAGTSQPPSLGGVTAKNKNIKHEQKAVNPRRFSIYIRLLFSASPTWLDYVLIAIGVIFAAVAGTPFPLMAILFGELVDQLNGATCAAEGKTSNDPTRYTSQVHSRILMMVYIASGAFVAIYVYTLTWGIISQRLAQRLRRQYFAALLRQPPSYIETHTNAGEVSSRLHGDITAVQAGTAEKAGIFIATISFCITAFTVGFLKQSRLAGMLFSMVPCFLLSSLLGSRYARKYSLRIASSMSTASSLASECITNISVVHAFGAGSRLEARFAELASSARQAGIQKSYISGIQTGLLYFVAYSGNAIAFWQGSRFIADSVSAPRNGTTMGDVYTVILVLVDASVLIGNLAPMLPIFSAAAAAFERLNKEIEALSAIDATSNLGRKLSEGKHSDPLSIDFDNVSFAYPSRATQPVLRNVSLNFPAAKYTAIVGLSGSGKSTIASLVTRLHDPQEGTIRVNGDDICQLNVKSLRSQIGFVQQEPSLLNTTILGNIAFGLVNSPKPEHNHLKPFLTWSYLAKLAKIAKEGHGFANATNLDPEALEIIKLVHDAAVQADAADFIEKLEDGYSTMTGPAGRLISGGQRQRIALAQALIRDPSVLLLDEATASVDSATERRIQGAIEQVARGRTVISIAHRLSTIRNADNIIVMDAGKVVEQGSYAELMSIEDGAFTRMASLQTRRTTDRDDIGSISGTTLDSSTLEDPILSSQKHEQKDVSVTDTESKVKAESEVDEKHVQSAAGPAPLDTKRSIGFILKKTGRIIRPSLIYFVFAIIAAFIVGATFSSSGVILGHVVGTISPCASTVDRIRSLGAFFAGMIFMLGSIEFFANFFSWSLFGLVAERLLYIVRVGSFRSLMEQGISWHQAQSPAKLLSIITKDTAAIGGFSGSTVSTILSILTNFVIAIVLSHIIAWKIAVVCLAAVPIMLGSGIMQLKMTARYQRRQAGAFDDATALAVETVQTISTVAALSLEEQILESFNLMLREPQKVIVKAAAFTNIWLAMHHSVGTFVYCLSYWWGTRLITRGEYSQTQFFIIQIAMLTSAKLWGTMFSLAPEFARAGLAASHVLNTIALGSGRELNRADLQSLEPAQERKRLEGTALDVEKGPDAKAPQPPHGRNPGMQITFSKVCFAYSNRPGIPVLNDISFTIQPGQFCGLVGPSGAGKSTILGLVQRLHSPTTGTVFLNGQDVCDLPPSFRDTIAVVPQDPTLFNASIRFNVALGAVPNTEATDAEIEEACRLANIHDTIVSLPDGYDTDCGPSGQSLSGGQRQRLAIARALVRRPQLLLLDESTSALDAVSEAALQEGLRRVSRGTTVLAITHRINTVQLADVILVVEGGCIVDSGKHNELMERRESYRINAMQQMLQ